MLLRFGVRNHLSLKDDKALVLTQSALNDTEVGLISTPAYKASAILPAAIIYGANASGKSNVISAMQIMRSHVLSSHSKGEPGGGVPRHFFALSKDGKTQDSRFEIDFISENVRYNYGYETDGNAFISEWLSSFPNGRHQKLFERNHQAFSFGRSFRGQNRTIEGLTRNNSLFISAAAQNDHEEALKVFGYIRNIKFGSHISVDGGEAQMLLRNTALDDRVIKFLGRIGTGVIGYKETKADVSRDGKAFRTGLQELMRNVLKIDMTDADFEKNEIDIQLGHKGEEGVTEYFHLARESSGTRRLLVLLELVFSALDEGSVIVIDELDASLHTQAVETLIALFSTKDTNRKGAQLIATIHDTNILHSKYLRRDQVWFTEKDESGATDLFPISDIKTRKNDNLEKGYLEGRYGAVPFSGPISGIISEL